MIGRKSRAADGRQEKAKALEIELTPEISQNKERMEVLAWR